MIQIIAIFKNILFRRETKILLGRWQIEKCSIKLNNKIRLSNEDNCSYRHETVQNDPSQKNISENDILIR
jgi:hypothetical protein